MAQESPERASKSSNPQRAWEKGDFDGSTEGKAPLGSPILDVEQSLQTRTCARRYIKSVRIEGSRQIAVSQGKKQNNILILLLAQ